MEALLNEVEIGMIRLETQLNNLKNKNKEITKTLKIEMKEVAAPV